MGRNIAAIGRNGVFVTSGMSREAGKGREDVMGTPSSWSRGVSFNADAGLTFIYRIRDMVTYNQRILRRGQTDVQRLYTVTLTTSAENEGLATRIPPSAFPVVIKGRVFVRMNLKKSQIATQARNSSDRNGRTAVMEGGEIAEGYPLSSGVVAAGDYLLKVSLVEPEITLNSFMAN